MNKFIFLVILFSFSLIHAQAKPKTRYFPTLNREALFDCALDFTIFCVFLFGVKQCADISNEYFDLAKNTSPRIRLSEHYTLVEDYTIKAVLSGLLSLGCMVGSLPFFIKAISHIPYILNNPSPEKITEENDCSGNINN